MKKLFLSIGCAAILAMSTLAVSCKKDDDSDFDKGKKAGKEYCECMEKAMADESSTMDCDDSKISGTSFSVNYILGVSEGMSSCN